MAVYDAFGGLKAAQRKRESQAEIERQIELEGEGLHEHDRYLLEINLEIWKILWERSSTTG